MATPFTKIRSFLFHSYLHNDCARNGLSISFFVTVCMTYLVSVIICDNDKLTASKPHILALE